MFYDKKAGKYYVLRASYTKRGKTYYAKDVGKKAFKIYVSR